MALTASFKLSENVGNALFDICISRSFRYNFLHMALLSNFSENFVYFSLKNAISISKHSKIAIKWFSAFLTNVSGRLTPDCVQAFSR